MVFLVFEKSDPGSLFDERARTYATIPEFFLEGIKGLIQFPLLLRCFFIDEKRELFFRMKTIEL